MLRSIPSSSGWKKRRTGAHYLQLPSAPSTETDDDDEIRYGVHAKGKINKDWTIGGMLGYQSDNRREYLEY